MSGSGIGPLLMEPSLAADFISKGNKNREGLAEECFNIFGLSAKVRHVQSLTLVA